MKREATIERLADHLLGHGLAAASLRPLAAAAGTSDRMLLYYFADRDELIGAVLERIAERLGALLDGAAPASAGLTDAQMLTALRAGLAAPALANFMRIWLELVARAARNEDPYRVVATRIADYFADWIAARLIDPHAAARVLAGIEGLVVLDAAGRPDLADIALADWIRPRA